MKTIIKKEIPLGAFFKDFFNDIIVLLSDRKWLLYPFSCYASLIMMLNLGMILVSTKASYFVFLMYSGEKEKITEEISFYFYAFILLFILSVLVISGMFVNISKKVLGQESQEFILLRKPVFMTFIRIFQLFAYFIAIIMVFSGIFLKLTDVFNTPYILKNSLGNAVLTTVALIAVAKISLVLPAIADGSNMGLLKSIIKTSGYDFYIFSIFFTVTAFFLIFMGLFMKLLFLVEMPVLIVVFSLLIALLKQLILIVLMVKVYKYFKENNLLV